MLLAFWRWLNSIPNIALFLFWSSLENLLWVCELLLVLVLILDFSFKFCFSCFSCSSFSFFLVLLLKFSIFEFSSLLLLYKHNYHKLIFFVEYNHSNGIIYLFLCSNLFTLLSHSIKAFLSFFSVLFNLYFSSFIIIIMGVNILWRKKIFKSNTKKNH